MRRILLWVLYHVIRDSFIDDPCSKSCLCIPWGKEWTQ